jgi:xanthine dehydrogenase accessory factor
MTCGGIVKLYFEAFNARRWRIVIFGAGHIANAVATLLVHFDCDLTVIDPRPEWLAKLPPSPKLTAVHAADMPSLVPAIPDDAFVALMTMGHATDKPILLEILRTRTFPYLGVIGSEAKANILRRDIAEAGLPKEMGRAFHCPIGIELGTNHPYEIALSVIAQMISRRDELAASRPVSQPASSSTAS